MKIRHQTELQIGDRVSQQFAGMPEPRYGTVTGFPSLEHGIFVLFDGEPRDKFTDLMDLRKGEQPSWWEQNENGKWRVK